MLGDWRNNAAAFAALLDSAAAALRASPVRVRSAVRLPARGRLLATGDIHGNAVHLEIVVRNARLSQSPDHHLVLQEIIHDDGAAAGGIDRTYRLLARVAELVLAHPGQVHPILANHEIAQCRGHQIGKAGVSCTDAFEEGLADAFGDEASAASEAVARFVHAMPLAVACANGVVVAHSLPNASAMRHFDLRVLERDLCEEDFDPPHGAAHLLTWGRLHDGPQLAAIAREWGASAFIVGHEPAPDGVLFRAPNLVILNTAHPRGRVIDVDLAAPRPVAERLAMSAVSVAALAPSVQAGEARA